MDYSAIVSFPVSKPEEPIFEFKTQTIKKKIILTFSNYFKSLFNTSSSNLNKIFK